MGGILSAIVGKPKSVPIDPVMVDTQREAREAADKRAAELKADDDARRRVIAGGGTGRVQLLAGSELGVTEPLKSKTGE